MADWNSDGAADSATEKLSSELTVAVPPAPETADSDDSPKQVKIFCHQCQQKLDVTGLQPFAHISCPVCGVDLIIPQWFDNYLLEEPCGRGGMSSVYRALDIALDREVAIKILDSDGYGNSEAFLNEARTAATINHSGVIPIYTCGVCDGQAYMVMQFMPGGSLEQKMFLQQGEPLPVEDVLMWIHDAAEGLEYAARRGIVHHDVKPGNIMLDADGNAKIGDFGIADRATKSMVGEELYGSPLYVSPEKVSTGKEDSAGDIYSLGASFYHLLTGVPPFQQENLEELLWARVKQDPPAPLQLRTGISPLISALIMRMLSRSPDLRPGYPEIIRTLNAVLHHTDTSSLVMHKEMPLPRGSGGSSSTATTSIRVIKSPSAMLKRRRSSVFPLPSVDPSDEPPISEDDLEDPESELPDEPKRKINWALTAALVLAFGVSIFLIYSLSLLIQARDFSPNQFLSVSSGKHRPSAPSE